MASHHILGSSEAHTGFVWILGYIPIESAGRGGLKKPLKLFLVKKGGFFDFVQVKAVNALRRGNIS